MIYEKIAPFTILLGHYIYASQIPVKPEFNGLPAQAWQGFGSKITGHQEDVREGIGFSGLKPPRTLDFTGVNPIWAAKYLTLPPVSGG